MILLKKLTWCPYWTMYSMDSPQRGTSDTSKYTNIMEACTILDPFELLYEEAIINLSKMGIHGFDFSTAEDILKPCYQQLRHGLGFDWVINKCVSTIAEYYPFTYHKEFSGTKKFIEQFENDPVFTTELESLHDECLKIIKWVFEAYKDISVYKRMAAYANTQNLEQAYEYILEHPPAEPFEIPFLTGTRINYLILFMEMLTIGVGMINREIWTKRMEAIQQSASGYEDIVAVVGSKFRLFAYGDVYGKNIAEWHVLEQGIDVNPLNMRIEKPDVTRITPDYMTFFEFSDSKLYIDESKAPMIQLQDDKGVKTHWLSVNDFSILKDLVLDKPMILSISYNFPQNPTTPKIVAIKGTLSTIIKDELITLDKDGVGITQIIFKSDSVGFKISDPEQLYPYAFFTSSNIKYSTTFEWLT